MAVMVPNNSQGDILGFTVNKSTPSDPVLRLFTNNITPAETDTAGTYTEASGSGYAAKTLTGSSWTITEGEPSNAAYAQQSFTFSGALGNVYGYYMTRTTGGRIILAERFSDAPVNVTASTTIDITPRLEGENV